MLFPIGRRFAGFTLAEVVVTSSLLVIAIVPILKGLTTGRLNTTIMERKTNSLILAQAKLDEIKARLIYSYDDTFGENDLSLEGRYLCDVADASVESDLRKITVSVGYDIDENDRLASDEVHVTFSTLIAKRW